MARDGLGGIPGLEKADMTDKGENMNKKLVKKDVDEAIRLNKKYYRTGDTDFLPGYRNALHKAFGNDDRWICDIITGLTCKRCDHNEPYSTYHKVLECLGYQIEGGIENEEVNEENC